MSTGTEHVPDAAHPDDRHTAGPPADDTDRATTRLVIVSIVATLAVAWTLVLAYGFTAENGADLESGRGWLLALVIGLVPGLLAAWAVRLVSETSDSAPTPYPVLAVICVALMVCGVAIAATFGGRAYDDKQSTIAAACSTSDVDLLSAFAKYGDQFSGAQGTADGTCEAHLFFPGEDGQALMGTLTSAMAADGWRTTDSAWSNRTYTRGSETVRVTHVRSSEGSTAIRFTVVEAR